MAFACHLLAWLMLTSAWILMAEGSLVHCFHSSLSNDDRPMLRHCRHLVLFIPDVTAWILLSDMVAMRDFDLTGQWHQG